MPISRTICELLEWKRGNGGLPIVPATAGTIAGARLVATSAGAAFGSAPGVSILVCDGACGDADCRQDIDQRGAEFSYTIDLEGFGALFYGRMYWLRFGATET